MFCLSLRQICVAFTFLCLIHISTAQDKFICTVGNDTITNYTADALQYFYPGFYVDKDTAILVDLLKKYYQSDRYLADKASFAHLDTSKEFKTLYAEYSALIKMKLLAKFASTNLKEFNPDFSVTNAEELNYYKVYSDKFYSSDTVTYMHVWLKDTSSIYKSKIDEAIKKYKNTSDVDLMSSKESYADYFITFEVHKSIKSKSNIDLLLRTKKLYNYFLYNIPKDVGYNYFCVLKRTFGALIPFDNVKFEIQNIISLEKQRTFSKQIDQEMNSMFPIRF